MINREASLWPAHRRPGAALAAHRADILETTGGAVPVIDHLKAEHRIDRNHLKGREGDRVNAVLAAAGYNFGLLLRWLAAIWRAIFAVIVNKPITTKSA